MTTMPNPLDLAELDALWEAAAIWKRKAENRSQGLVDLNLDRAAQGVEIMQLREELDALRAELVAAREGWPAEAKFQNGDKVSTARAPFWLGTICGWYRNSEGRLGYNVEAEAIPLAIHNYPEGGLVSAPPAAQEVVHEQA